MALAVTSLTAAANNADNTAFTTASVTPTAGALVLIAVTSRRSTTPGVAPTITSPHSLATAWTDLTQHFFDTTINTGQVVVWGAIAGATPGSGAITANFGGGNTQITCAWTVVEVTGYTGSGLGPGPGSNIVQIVKNGVNPGNATSGSATLAAATHSANRPLAFIAVEASTNIDITPRTNWTELNNAGATASGGIAIQAQWRNDAFETTASATWTDSVPAGIIAAEINAANPPVILGQATETDTASVCDTYRGQILFADVDIADADTNITDGNAYTLATHLRPDVAGTVAYGRWRFPDTLPSQPVTYTLFDKATTAELGSGTFEDPQPGRANLAELDTPVNLTAGQSVYAAVWTPDRYIADGEFHLSDVTRGDLTAPANDNSGPDGTNGRFKVGGTEPQFPDSQFNASAYFVDMVFIPSTAAPPVVLGLATETDTATAAARVKTRTVGPASDADSATPIIRSKTRSLGLAAEADSATATSRVKSQTLGLTAQADTATAVVRDKARTLSLATSTEAAQPTSRIKARTVGQATEADSGRQVTTDSAVALGTAIETTTANPLGRVKTASLDRADETDTATGTTRAKGRPLAQAVETGTAQPIAAAGTVTLGFAAETNVAHPVTVGAPVVLGLAAEVATVTPLGRTKTLTVGGGVEQDTATPAIRIRSFAVGQAVETATARQVGRTKRRLVGQATNSDTALPTTVAGPATAPLVTTGRNRAGARTARNRATTAAPRNRAGHR